MRRYILRVVVLCIAVLLITTAMVASETPNVAPQENAQSNTVAMTDAGGYGLDLALGSIVLGGAMVFLFRPKRRTT